MTNDLELAQSSAQHHDIIAWQSIVYLLGFTLTLISYYLSKYPNGEPFLNSILLGGATLTLIIFSVQFKKSQYYKLYFYYICQKIEKSIIHKKLSKLDNYMNRYFTFTPASLIEVIIVLLFFFFIFFNVFEVIKLLKISDYDRMIPFVILAFANLLGFIWSILLFSFSFSNP